MSEAYLRKKKNNVFEFRRAIPPAYRYAFGGQTERIKSLGTADKALAMRLRDRFNEEFEQELSAAKQGKRLPNFEKALFNVQSWMAVEVQNIYTFRRGPVPPFATDEQIQTSIKAYLTTFAPNLPAEINDLIFYLGPGEYRRYRDLQEHVIKFSSVAELQASTALPLLIRANQIIFNPALPAADALTDDRSQTPISVVLAKYFSLQKLPAGTEHEWRLAWRRLMEVFGDLPIGDITRRQIREVVDLLFDFPKNIGTKERKLPLPDIIDRYRKKGAYVKISVTTVEKYVSAFRSVLSWAEHDYIDQSPAMNLRIKIRNKTKGKITRMSFSAKDSNMIFTSGIYSPDRVLTKKDWMSADFWVPMIAHWTGARLEEIGQLQIADLKVSKGIRYFDISTLVDDDPDEDPSLEKRLKNVSSRRFIPIHPMLFDLGFAEFVEAVRKSGALRLFPELERDERGSVTQAFSRKWNRKLRKIIKDRRKVFHSFRHAWKDRAGDCNMPENCKERIQGHVLPGVGATYGSGIPVSKLDAAMRMLDHPDVDLSHLLAAVKRFRITI